MQAPKRQCNKRPKIYSWNYILVEWLNLIYQIHLGLQLVSLVPLVFFLFFLFFAIKRTILWCVHDNFDLLGTFGSVHRLQLCNQPIHLPPLQFKFTKSTDDHQVCQITFRVSDNISDQKLHTPGNLIVTKKWREFYFRNCCPMAICKTGNNISRWSTVQNLQMSTLICQISDNF